MDLSGKCLVCDSPKNLNTMIVDGNQIGLCLEHADDMTIKQIKELLKTKTNKQDVLHKRLEDMDKERDRILVELGEKSASSLAAKSDPEQLKPIAEAKPKEIKSIPQPKYMTNNIKTNVSGVSKYQGIDIASVTRNAIEEAKRKGKIDEATNVPVRFEQQEQVVPGRGGSPMKIPSKIKDSTGVTTIRIVNTGGDVALQKRAKAAAIEVPTCPSCNGMGQINNIFCKKCSGDGILRK